MEIKRPKEITEADIPKIEYPFFASTRVSGVFEGFGALHVFGIKELDEIVESYMPRFLGNDQRKLSAYWEYYKGSGKKKNWDYDFHNYNPVKDQVLEDFKWGKYLIVLQTEAELFRSCTLFRQDETPRVNPHDRWKQYGDALPSSDYMGFEGILNRIYPDRKRLDYHPFYGPSSGVGETGESAEEITLSPEPWPEENTTVLQTSVAAAAQPALKPTPKPAPSTTLPRTPPANDPVFNVKKGIRLTRVLGGIVGVILGVFIPDNASLEEEWDVDGVNYKYNTDDFSLEITNPDGSKEQVIMYPDGTVTDQQGAILGSAAKEGGFTPATEQEEVDFRVWKANGGEGSFAVWKNSGKPLETSSPLDGAKSKAIEIDTRDGGHSVARHGADISDKELKKRLETGIAPDGKFSPTPASTRFKSHEEWLKTRKDALKEIEKREGIDLREPPKPSDETKYDIKLDHGRSIDEGFVGNQSIKVKITDSTTGKKGTVFPGSRPVSGITRTQTRVKWNPESSTWRVIQHYPDAKNWNQSIQSYEE